MMKTAENENDYSQPNDTDFVITTTTTTDSQQPSNRIYAIQLVCGY